MRTFLLAAAAAAVACAVPATAATRNFGITSFTRVRVEGPFKVSLATGVAPFARASGSPSAIDHVAIDVQGDTLIVHSSTSSWGGYPGANSGPVEITLGTHDLTNVWVNGAGTLAVDRVKGLSFALSVQGSGAAEIGEVSADQVTVSLIGTASSKLAGRTRKLTALVRGISTLDATGLAARDALIGAEGAATVNANAFNEVTINASGPATVRLTGQPSCTVKAAGSASVSGCR